MGSVEIVKAAETLPSQEEVAGQLDRLEGAGDTEALNEVALQAKAFEEYERRSGAAERAAYFARIKLMAEARIGSIDLQLHVMPGNSELVLGGGPVPRSRRAQWRMLGAGLQSGQFDRALKVVEEKDSICTSAAVRELRDFGSFYVETAPLLKRYQELYRSEGLTISEVERRAGLPACSGYLSRPGTTPPHDKTMRHAALRVAAVLGVDPGELRSVPMRRKAAKRPRPRRARKLSGGRLDETYSLIRKALQELDRATAQSGQWGTGEAWEHLYKAEEIIGNALHRAPRNS